MAKAKVPLRERYRTSRAIFGQALRMLRRHPDLLVFPALGVLAVVLGVVPLLVVAAVNGWIGTSPWLVAVVIIPLTAPFGWLASLTSLALVHAANERFEGRPGHKRAAWRHALSLAGPALRFTLIATLVAGLLQVVGLLLDKLRLVPWLGHLLQVVGALGFAAASFFVVPVLILERERSAVGALKTSSRMAREQWGNAVSGIVTIGLAVMLPLLVVMVLAAITLFVILILLPVGAPLAMGGLWALMGLAGLGLLVAMVMGQAVTPLYQTALYRYATTGRVAEPFDRATLVDAWAPYRQKP